MIERRRVANHVALILVILLLSFGPATVAPAQPQGPAFLPQAIRDAVSGVVRVGPPRTAPISLPGFSGPIGVGFDVVVRSNPGPQNEPEIDTDTVVDGFPHAGGANDYGTGTGDARCGAYFTTNGGISWSNSQAGTAQLPHPPALVAMGLNVSGDPDVAFSTTRSAGSAAGFPFVYYSCLAFSRTIGSGSIFVARSTNGGASYTALDSGIVAVGSPSVFHDKEFLAVDTNSRSPFLGSVYVCWTMFHSGGSDILFRRSTTQATSWLHEPPGLALSNPNANSQGCDVAVGPDGTVYVAWLEFTTDLCNGNIRIRRSDDGGATFAPEATVAAVSKPAPCNLPSRAPLGAYRINNFPRIATDRGGHVGVVFSSTACYPVNNTVVCSVGLDIWFARSGRTATAWSFFRRVNQSRTSLDQHFPVVKASANSWFSPPSVNATQHGSWFVCFNDRSWATVAGDFDTACSHSHNDGSSWATVERVSDISSFDGQFGGTFIGDYIGLALSSVGALFGGGHIHPIFQRNSAAGSGEMNIYSENAALLAPLAPANGRLP